MFITVLAVVLALPVEGLFLQTVLSQSVQGWASNLPPQALAAAGAKIEQFPYAYRRAIMGALPPAARAAVWQNHINAYIRNNPGLDSGTVALLQTAAGLLTADLFTDPTPDQRAAVHAVGDQLQTLLGKDQAQYVMFRLGPVDSAATQSAVPLAMRLQDYLSNTLLAQGSQDCECEVSFGCYDYSSHCTSAQACSTVTSWPACGWFWMDPCDGLCAAGN